MMWICLHICVRHIKSYRGPYSACTTMCAQSLSHVWLMWPHGLCSMPDSSVYGIFHTKILEWVVISLSKGSSWSRDQTHISCVFCTGRQILYCYASWEACTTVSPIKRPQGWFYANIRRMVVWVSWLLQQTKVCFRKANLKAYNMIFPSLHTL